MNSFVTKICVITTMVCLFLFVLNSFNALAAEGDDIIVLEGSWGSTGVRSVTKQPEAMLIGSNVNISLYQYLPWVTVSIKNTHNNEIIYCETYANPMTVSVSLDGLTEGCYMIELRSDSGYMYGTFLFY